MNVYQKINEVKKSIKGFFKDAKTEGYGAYRYVSGTQILSAVKDKMEELGLLFIPVSTTGGTWTTYDYTNGKGQEKTDFVVNGKMKYAWVNCEEPDDKLEVDFEYFGQQNDVSKAYGSALTYSERYLLLKSLGVPTDDEDPDTYTDTKTTYKNVPPKAESKKMTLEEAKSTVVTNDKNSRFCGKTFGELTEEDLKSIEPYVKGDKLIALKLVAESMALPF